MLKRSEFCLLLLFCSTAAAQLRITTTSVPVATQYQAYSATLNASGGTPPYTWSVVSSTGVSLPEGMALTPSTGLLSAAQVNGQGGYAVTVQVTDSGSPSPAVATATLDFGVNSDTSFAGCEMFPPDSIYNQRIDLLPVDNNASHQIPSAYLASPLHPDFGHGFYPAPGGIPWMRVPSNQPPTNVNLAASGQIDSAGTYAWPFAAWPNAVIEGTSDGQAGNDHHILVLQASTANITGPQTGACILYETYQDTAVPAMFNPANNTWSMLAGVHYVLTSDEIAASNSTLDDGAQDSPGIPMVPLLLRYSEVPLAVEHPLRISFPSPTNGYVWPATGCCTGSGPPQGLLYRLKASVNWQATCPASTHPEAATVLQALQQYGAYMSDHGSPGYVSGVPDVRWNDNDLGCIKQFPVSDLEVVNNSALEISPISGQTRPYVVPLSFAAATVGVSYSATPVAVGGNPAALEWAVTAGALPAGLLLNPSTGAISGQPTSAAGSPFAFSLAATDTASGYASQSQAFSIAVTGGSFTLSPSSVAFGGQTVNTASGAQTITMTNNGSTALTIGSIAFSGADPGDFTQSNNCPATLPAGNSCAVSVTFRPAGAGARSAALSVTANGAGNPPFVGLSGTGVAPIPTVSLQPAGLTFPNEFLKTASLPQTIALTNNGPGALTINSISIGGANAGDFAPSNNCPISPNTLAANNACQIAVVFTPAATGARTAVLSITDNGAASPQTVGLSGTGVASVPTAWPNGYTYQADFTVAAGQVPAALSNFPLLISGTFSDFATAANGGRIANTCTQTVGNHAIAVPCDLVFTSDAAGATLLAWEFESWTPATGAVNVWVNAPNLSSGTTIYAWYGQSAVATLQSTPSATWNSNFAAVYHLAENPAGTAPQLNDSTANGNQATMVGPATAGQQQPGVIGGSMSFTANIWATLATPATFSFERTDSFSLSFWVKIASNTSATLLSKLAPNANGGWALLQLPGAAGPELGLALVGSGGSNLAIADSPASAGAWHYLVATYSGTGTVAGMTLYLDGGKQTLATLANNLGSSILNSLTAAINSRSSGFAESADSLDEIRISSRGVVFSPAFVTASFNNQSRPAAFFTVVTGLTISGN